MNQIDEKIDELQDTLDDETLTDSEKNKAKREISKLKREKSPLISDIKEKKDEEKEVYEELKKELYSKQKKVGIREKTKKNSSKETRGINSNEGYYYVPTTPISGSVSEEPEKEEVKSDEPKEEEPKKEEVKNENPKEEPTLKEKGMIATGSAVIDSFLNSNIDEENYIYENEFKPLSEAFNNATLKNNLKKQQKAMIRQKIGVRESELSKDLVSINNISLFDAVAKDVYGEDAEKLSKYLSLDETGNLGFSNEIFDNIYTFHSANGVVLDAKMNDIENMDDRTLNLLNNMILKYQERIEDGSISKGNDLDKKFSKTILEPAKLQIINYYAKELEKPFIFRKLSGIFNSKKKSKFEKFRDLIEKTSDITKERKVENKLDLSDSVSSQDELLHSDLEKSKVVPEEEIKKAPEELTK